MFSLYNIQWNTLQYSKKKKIFSLMVIFFLRDVNGHLLPSYLTQIFWHVADGARARKTV